MEKQVNVNLAGLPTLLTVLFVALKLLGKIDWSWWWVLAPMWISFGLVFAVLIVVAIIAVAIACKR